jgi:hypothetical protein
VEKMQVTYQIPTSNQWKCFSLGLDSQLGYEKIAVLHTKKRRVDIHIHDKFHTWDERPPCSSFDDMAHFPEQRTVLQTNENNIMWATKNRWTETFATTGIHNQQSFFSTKALTKERKIHCCYFLEVTHCTLSRKEPISSWTSEKSGQFNHLEQRNYLTVWYGDIAMPAFEARRVPVLAQTG